MVALSPTDISRSYRHLGFGNGEGIPAGDVARLVRATALVRDTYQRDHIKAILDRCDDAWTRTQLGTTINYESQELYAGDINRTIKRDRPGEARRIWWEYYLGCTDELAHELWVPNYWRDENLRYRFSDHGGEFIMSVPGPSGEFTATVSFSGAPTSTPSQTGLFYVNAGVDPAVFYISTGTTSSADWKTASSATSLDGLSDVILTTPTSTQILQYNGTTWVNVAAPATNLDGLSDVVLTTPSANQVLQYDGATWVNATPTSGSGGRTQLTANRTYYVSTTGSNTNDGLTSGTPFLTVQKAIDTVAGLDLNGFTCTIQLADGTYSNAELKSLTGKGRVTIQGNAADSSLVVIGSNGVTGTDVFGEWTLKRLTIGGSGLQLSSFASVVLDFVKFAQISFYQCYLKGNVHVLVANQVNFAGSNTYGIYLENGATFDCFNATLAAESGVSYSSAFVWANVGSKGIFNGVSGTATGQKYDIRGNSVVRNADSIPGSVAGTTQTGGVVV